MPAGNNLHRQILGDKDNLTHQLYHNWYRTAQELWEIRTTQSSAHVAGCRLLLGALLTCPVQGGARVASGRRGEQIEVFSKP